MRQLLKVLSLCCFTQLTFATTHLLDPIKDTIPDRTWTIGLQTGYVTNNYTLSAFQLGLTIERKLVGLFALESEINGEYRKSNLNVFGQGEADAINLDLALNAKMYFSKSKRWYSKLGYYRTYNLRNNILSDNEWIPSSSHSPIMQGGLQLGVGHNWLFSSGKTLKLEGLLKHNKFDGLIGGLRVGFVF